MTAISFISKGPQVPTELLEAHENGDLVFFCGAGVSMRAGLPSFRGLVEKVAERVGAGLTKEDNQDLGRGLYDRILHRWDQKYVGNRVRTATTEILALPEGAELDTHRALLDLSRDQDGKPRIVTTNFDQGFVRARPDVPRFSAPALRPPRKSSWDAIIHLHGVIGDHDPDGRDFVLTSADFGRAYLIDGWASRFVAQLFQSFTVVFVGYSVSDPVIRYVVDAFAADRAAGEKVGEAYVFAPHGKGDDAEEALRWRQLGLEPLLYLKDDEHRALHESLQEWAHLNRNGPPWGSTGNHSTPPLASAHQAIR